MNTNRNMNMNMNMYASFLTRTIVALLCITTIVAEGDSHQQFQLRGASSSDPRTIEIKSDSSNTSASNSINDHGDDVDFSNLRFAVFGTSRAYGSHLKEEDRLKMAFPFLLSSNVVNLAIPASNSAYTEKCAYSMIGEENIYDVIILEYMAVCLDSTLHLANRLHQRFPNAYIMVLNVWAPSAFQHLPTKKSLFYWLADQGIQDIAADDPMIAKIVKEKTTPNEWVYMGPYKERHFQAIKEAGFAHVAPPPHRDINEAVENHRWFIDNIHFSEIGHQMVKELIYDELRRANFRTRHNVVNPWTTFDQCDSWFGDGKIDFAHSEGFVMNQFKDNKYALEAREENSWIKVENKSPKVSDLFLFYMTAAPDCLYETNEIIMSSSPETSTWIRCDDVREYSFPVHVAKRLFLGKIGPGETTLQIKSFKGAKKWPFRLTGTIITEPEESGSAVNAA